MSSHFSAGAPINCMGHCQQLSQINSNVGFAGEGKTGVTRQKTSRCRVQNQQTQRISKKVDTEQKLIAIVSRVALRLTFIGLSTRLREDLMDIHTTSPHGQTLI